MHNHAMKSAERVRMFVPRRALLLASSAQPASKLNHSSFSSASRTAREVSAKTMYYDSHLHVWATKEDGESGKYPFAVRIPLLQKLNDHAALQRQRASTNVPLHSGGIGRFKWRERTADAR